MSETTSFVLNGARVTSHANSDTSLALVLRNELGDKSPRIGCMLEQCGSCRVLVDDEPVFACTADLETVAGKRVETAAAIDSPVVQALLDGNAAQCGYCLAGIAVSAEALFRSHRAVGTRPARSDIVQALDAHLCRCGSQARILRLLEDVEDAS